MSDFSFIDRDGDEISAEAESSRPHPDSLIELNLNGGGQCINFYVADAPAVISIIQQAAGIEA